MVLKYSFSNPGNLALIFATASSNFFHHSAVVNATTASLLVIIVKSDRVITPQSLVKYVHADFIERRATCIAASFVYK